jgi:hypothetical protein
MQKSILIIVFTWIFQIWFSLPSWIGGQLADEYFFNFYHPLLNNTLTILFILSLLCITFCYTHRKLLYFLSAALLVALCTVNIHLIQPWQLVNLFLLGCFVFKQTHLAVLIFSGLFFWSGMNKVNPWFQTEIFSWFFSPLFNGKWQQFYFLIPAIEITSAILLLFQKTRKNAVIVCIAKHIFVVFMLSPLFHNWNYVVIPWNIGLASILYVLYLKPVKINISNYDFKLLRYIIIIFFWICPALWYIGLWPFNLSFQLYSGYHSSTYLYADNGYKKEIEQYYIVKYGVPLYVSDHSLRSIKNKIVRKHPNITLMHIYKLPFIKEKKLKQF